jgi:hypothetical protein
VYSNQHRWNEAFRSLQCSRRFKLFLGGKSGRAKTYARY